MADRCPVGMKVQTLIFSKSEFLTRFDVRRWLGSHGYAPGFIDEKPGTYRVRQESPAKFAYFRTIRFRKGVQAVVGCPRSGAMRRAAENPLPSTALWIGAGLAAAVGAYLIGSQSKAPVVAPTPPPPTFGSETPEVLQAIGPYGVAPVQNA